MAILNWNNISWKNTMTFAAPAALSTALLQAGSVKKVTIEDGRESLIKHEFPYFDEIPPEVMSYLLGPAILAAVAFASATMLGKFLKNEEGGRLTFKESAIEGAHLGFKVLLAMAGANLGKELFGEGMEGMLAVAGLAGLGVVIADAISEQQVYKRAWNWMANLRRLWKLPNNSPTGLFSDAVQPASFAEYRNYTALFIAVVAASICFTLSPELALDWIDVENSLDHGLCAGAATFFGVGASFAVLMPVLKVGGKELVISASIMPTRTAEKAGEGSDVSASAASAAANFVSEIGAAIAARHSGSSTSAPVLERQTVAAVAQPVERENREVPSL